MRAFGRIDESQCSRKSKRKTRKIQCHSSISAKYKLCWVIGTPCARIPPPKVIFECLILLIIYFLERRYGRRSYRVIYHLTPSQGLLALITKHFENVKKTSLKSSSGTSFSMFGSENAISTITAPSTSPPIESYVSRDSENLVPADFSMTWNWICLSIDINHIKHCNHFSRHGTRETTCDPRPQLRPKANIPEHNSTKVFFSFPIKFTSLCSSLRELSPFVTALTADVSSL